MGAFIRTDTPRTRYSHRETGVRACGAAARRLPRPSTTTVPIEYTRLLYDLVWPPPAHPLPIVPPTRSVMPVRPRFDRPARTCEGGVSDKPGRRVRDRTRTTTTVYKACEARSSLPQPCPGPSLDSATVRLRIRVHTLSVARDKSQVRRRVFSALYDTNNFLEPRTRLPRTPDALSRDFARTRRRGRISTVRQVLYDTEPSTRTISAAQDVYRRPEAGLCSHSQRWAL